MKSPSELERDKKLAEFVDALNLGFEERPESKTSIEEVWNTAWEDCRSWIFSNLR